MAEITARALVPDDTDWTVIVGALMALQVLDPRHPVLPHARPLMRKFQEYSRLPESSVDAHGETGWLFGLHDVVDVEEAAAMTGKSKPTIRRWCSNGRWSDVAIKHGGSWAVPRYVVTMEGRDA